MEKIIESANDTVMQEDLEAIVRSEFPIDKLENSTVFVTGATGLIGSQIVRTLACFNRLKQSNISIIAFARSTTKAEKVFGSLLSRGDVKVCIGDVNDRITVDGKVDYIIHGASATSSKYFVSNPVETIQTAMNGTTHILEFAKEKTVKGMVYLSSLEVYGTPDRDRKSVV